MDSLRHVRAIVWTAALLVLAAGLLPAAAASSLAAYFPMAPGTVWTYATNTSGEIRAQVGSTLRVAGIECRMIEMVVNGEVAQRECYRVTADGVYAYQRSYAAGTVVLEPPQRMLASPVTVGKKWQWAGRVGEHDVAMDYTWARREVAVVPAGRFDAMQLYFEGNIGPQVRIQSWRWFAPGVGMVKEDSTLTQGPQSLRIYAELVRVTRGR
jgi:hypothetical protein